MRSGPRRSRFVLVVALALGACGDLAAPGEPSPPPAHGPGVRTLVARDLRMGVTAPDGSRRRVRIDRVRLVPGRLAGLRVPVLDAVAFEGVRVSPDAGQEPSGIDVRVGPYGLLPDGPGHALPAEVQALLEGLAKLSSGASRAGPGSAWR